MPAIQIRKLLQPKSIAIVGASKREMASGTLVLRHLRSFGFPGSIFPVNPRYEAILGLRCYPSLSDLPETVDLVFIAIPAEPAIEVLGEAGRCGIGAAIINASGFAEAGPPGRRLQEKLTTIAQDHAIAVCGPNNMGLINFHDRVCLWTNDAHPPAEPGSVALISQSGSVVIALCEDDRRLGLAYAITAGNEAVCSAAEYLQAMVDSEHTQVIMMFLETIRKPGLFAEAALEAAHRGKRIIAVKAGRSEIASKVIASHTGSLAGEDQIYDAYFRRYGVIRAADLNEMVESAKLFLSYPEPPSTPNIVPITMSGGEAALIADVAQDLGLSISEFSQETAERIRAGYPPFTTPRNPLDAYSKDWSVDNFQRMVDALLCDPEIGVLVCAVDAPASGGADAGLVSEMTTVCGEAARKTDKRIVFLNNTSGGGINPEFEAKLGKVGIPFLLGMAPAFAAIAHWANYRTPDLEAGEIAIPEAFEWRRWATDAEALSEPQRFNLLSGAGVNMVECLALSSVDEALEAASRFGYPVAMKGCAPDLVHKTEGGLVQVGLADRHMVENAFAELTDRLHRATAAHEQARIVVQPMVPEGVELLIGVRNDTRFGSLIVVGLGGTLVEVVREVSMRIGPVDRLTALEMLNETRAGTLLAGVRGRGPFDCEAAAAAIVALSRFGAATHGILASIEVNPLIVLEKGDGVFGVDLVLEPAMGGRAD